MQLDDENRPSKQLVVPNNNLKSHVRANSQIKQNRNKFLPQSGCFRHLSLLWNLPSFLWAEINVSANCPGSDIPSICQIMLEEGALLSEEPWTRHDWKSDDARRGRKLKHKSFGSWWNSKGGLEIVPPQWESIRPSVGGERPYWSGFNLELLRDEESQVSFT